MSDADTGKRASTVKIIGADADGEETEFLDFSNLKNDNPEFLSSFGDQMANSYEPIVQLTATYGFLDELEIFTASGGTATEEDNMFICKTGTTVGGYSVVRSRRSGVYRAGLGLMGRFTAIFSTGVANSLQFAGLFNLTDTLAFGYKGTDFGVVYEYFGAPEIRQMQVTSSGNGTLSLTLDGTLYSIPITTGTVNHNAYEIEAWMNANQTVWNAEQHGDHVVFQARDSSARNGTYSESGGGSFAGTITQLQAGATKTDGFISSSNFSHGLPAGFDPTKAQVYQIKVSYLGFGPIGFYVSDLDTGRFKLVHCETFTGVNTKPSISKKALKVGWTAASLGSTTDLTVKGASAAMFVEGESKILSRPFSISNENTAVPSTGFEAVLTIRCQEVFFNKVLLGKLNPVNLSITNQGIKPAAFKLVKNATLGETDFSHVEDDVSCALYDTGSHTLSGGKELLTGFIDGESGTIVSLKGFDIDINPTETLTLFAKMTQGSSAEVDVSFTWKEDI